MKKFFKKIKGYLTIELIIVCLFSTGMLGIILKNKDEIVSQIVYTQVLFVNFTDNKDIKSFLCKIEVLENNLHISGCNLEKVQKLTGGEIKEGKLVLPK